MHRIAEGWQKSLPILAVVGAALWLVLFHADPASERAMFAALLVVYMVHQIEEHLWPGGFRQYANAHVFKSGRDDWPVDEGGVALVNIGWVWLPIALAALFPDALRWLGLGWVGLTFVNALSHIGTTVRFRGYNPGLVTSIVLFLPFTIWVFATEVSRGALSGAEIGGLLVAGVLLHVPVAALFVVPFRRKTPALV
ncbi:HXXEE domain-containing protein [Rhodoplanes sp.]|uniref:HXXEE domain-containing protein n=1 Tax=Rhodoplanes sp. TaxID=1968906 RepID=UPI0025EBB998|nr:HXXEE domain-containing protein [Rhodoplanes sp.]